MPPWGVWGGGGTRTLQAGRGPVSPPGPVGSLGAVWGPPVSQQGGRKVLASPCRPGVFGAVGGPALSKRGGVPCPRPALWGPWGRWGGPRCPSREEAESWRLPGRPGARAGRGSRAAPAPPGVAAPPRSPLPRGARPAPSGGGEAQAGAGPRDPQPPRRPGPAPRALPPPPSARPTPGTVLRGAGRTMARRAAVALLLLGLLGTLRPARGQDFDLSDALGDNDKKPTAPPKKPSPDDDGFSLEDALGGGGNNDPVPPNPPKPKPNPNPNQPGSSGGFSDSDLVDGASDGGGGGGGGGGSQRPDGEEQADSPGVVPGIIGAVVVAVAGAISSFIAYQKKKLCFKENADQGDTSTKNQQSTNAEQPVQWTLLEK
uniref:CD99 molecule (Xg blood group) n=2 Tax=Canis lupus TaxID=9612 RepID=A0A8P0TNE8_CANLF